MERSDKYFYIMVRMVEELARRGLPVVVQGSLILKLEAMSRGMEMRATKDIDMQWVGYANMSDVLNIFNDVLNNIDNNLYAEIERNYQSDGKARYEIHKSGLRDPVFRIDLHTGDGGLYCVYTTYNNVNFYGATPLKRFVDKLSVISNNIVRRRIKDIFDMYVMSFMYNLVLSDIVNTLNNRGIRLGDFYAFIHEMGNLRQAYNKMVGINIKPPFEDVYGKVYRITEPFRNGINRNAVWNGDNWVAI